jgi:hypothetical protein
VAEEQEAQHDGQDKADCATVTLSRFARSLGLYCRLVIPAAAAFDGRKRLLPEIRCRCAFLAKSGVTRRDPARELIDFGSFLPNIGAHGTNPFNSRAFAYGSTLTGLHPFCAQDFKKSAVCEKYGQLFACQFQQQ